MTIHVHGGHEWVWMGVGRYNLGWGTGRRQNEKRPTIFSRGLTHTVQRKRTKNMVRCGGTRIFSGDKPTHTRHVLRPILPNQKQSEETKGKKETDQQHEQSQTRRAHIHKRTYTTPEFGTKKQKNKQNQLKKNAQLSYITIPCPIQDQVKETEPQNTKKQQNSRAKNATRQKLQKIQHCLL